MGQTGKAGALPRSFPTKAAAARYFGVAASTVNYWIQRGMPRNPDGSFSRAKCEKWRLEFEGKKATAGGKGASIALERAQAELHFRRERAKKTELERRALEGSMIAVVDHEAALVERAVFFRRALLVIPRSLALTLAQTGDPVEVETRLREELEGVLWAAYRHGSGKKRDDPDDDSAPAAAAT